MSNRWRAILGIAGVLVGAGVSVAYASVGFRPAMPYVLIAAVAAIAFSLRKQAGFVLPSSAPVRSDLIAVGILLVVMAPLYWWRLYSTPWQINTDEVTIMLTAKRVLSMPAVDLFGVNLYFGFPPAVFVFVGRLAELMGGIDLFHSRAVHATLGICCVLLSYGFFRQSTEPVRAASLSMLLGANHALFAISRMAMRENTALFFELLTLWLLTRGIQQHSRAQVFLAGVSTGLAFYAYFPGRIALVIVIAVFVGIVALNFRRDVVRRAAECMAIFVFGWGLIASPVMIASRANSAFAFSYARQQFLIYPEGRKLEMEWTGEKTPEGAWKANIRNGLRMFNSPLHDQGYIYPNYKHGFVDPMTGVLIWIGLVISGVGVVRRRKTLLADEEGSAVALGDVVALVGFLGIYVSCAFLITKAPNYTRLLVVLPFVSYLAGTALWQMAEWLARGSQSARRALITVGVGLIATWNVSMFRDFVQVGREHGNDVGSTGRYVEARKNAFGYVWVLATDKTHPYYSWGDAWQWKDWAGFFAGPNQTMRVSPVDSLSFLNIPGNFTVLTTNAAWQSTESEFRIRHPLYEVHWLTPDSRLIAIDVRAARGPPGG